MTLRKKFSTNLKALRDKKKLTQGDLALRAGVSVSYISMLEHNFRSPQLSTIEQLSRALRVTPQAMLQ